MLCHNCLKFVAFHLKEILRKEIKNIRNIRNSGISVFFQAQVCTLIIDDDDDDDDEINE